jgi:DNA-binding transcriptional regulator YdaS (Cro superfamily)
MTPFERGFIECLARLSVCDRTARSLRWLLDHPDSDEPAPIPEIESAPVALLQNEAVELLNAAVDRLGSTKAVAKALSVDPTNVRKWRRSGRIPGHRLEQIKRLLADPEALVEPAPVTSAAVLTSSVAPPVLLPAPPAPTTPAADDPWSPSEPQTNGPATRFVSAGDLAKAGLIR